MKLIRIGNDIKIEWTITRYGEPEDFTGKNLSVGLYDKFNEKQTFDYIIDGNVIYGTLYGKDQTTNGVYRLYLTENEGKEDMVTLDYIDCFCISNKLKNQTSNGQDPSSINTEVVQLTSNINIGGAGGSIVQADWDDDDPHSPHYIQNKPELFSGDYDDLTNKPYIPTKTSDLTNDSNYVTASSLATVATSGNYNDLSNKPNLFSGNYNDLTNKPYIPTKTSDLTNDSNYVTASSLATVATSGNYNDLSNKPSIPTKTSDLNNDSGFVTLSIFSTVATSGDYNDLINKPTIPVVPTYVSAFTNDANYINQIKTINNMSLIGEGNINISGGSSVQSDWAQTDTTADDYIKNKPSLATVATSGNYNDLSNKPTIPTKTSDLTNDSNYVTASSLATVATSGNYNDLSNKPTIPTKTSDLTNDSGFVTLSIFSTVATSGDYNDLINKPSLFSGNYNDLTNKPTIPTKTSDLTNDSGFVASTSLATVATSGNYNDLTNKPTIPVVPTYVSAFTNDAGYLTQHQSLSNYVTLNSSQNITGTKTFVGEKKIFFSQSSSSDKLGFTLNDNNAKEVASVEFRPNTVTYNNVNHPLLYFGHYRNNTIASAGVPQTCVGFRQYDQANSAAFHFLIPLPEMAKTTFSLTTTFKDFYAPLGFKLNTSTTKLAGDDGLVDISDCVTSSNTNLKIEVVSVMPVNPDQNTLYIVA